MVPKPRRTGLPSVTLKPAAAISAYLSEWPDDYRRPELQARLAQLEE